jgi:uncharacterized OB-fold protein
MTGTVYTETTVYAAPEAFVSEAPYQIAIVTFENGERVTGRVRGERVAIEDQVTVSDEQNGVPVFHKQA